jgi:hypothetical protein
MADEPGGPANADHLTAALDAVAEGWERAARASQQLIDGSYGRDDIADDVAWYTGRWLECARDVAVCWARLLAGLGRGPGGELPHPQPRTPTPNPEITVVVPDDLTGRPLQASGFRAIGWGGAFAIPVGDVVIGKPVLAGGVSTFVVTVSSAGLPLPARKRTIVYEGRVTAAQTGNLVAGPIRFVKPAE